MTCLICILWGVNELEMDKIGGIEISKIIATAQASDGGSSGGAE